ncbi:hypothetical protein PINS_up000221 [Pythium insidiosum]|nr:hypothetical protein PINS_up000221 [Pythium insidiosum]
MLPTALGGANMEDVEPTAEELALKQHVTKALESQGVLGKIRAQLRAAVFQAVHSTAAKATDGLTPRSSSSTLAGANAVALFGNDGRLALELVADFLDALALEHTLAVFLAETNAEHHGVTWRPSKALCERVGVSPKDERMPVLVELVRQQAAGDSAVKVDATRSLRQSNAVRSEPRPVEPAGATDTTIEKELNVMPLDDAADGGRRSGERKTL